jgi:hypothetical protein
MLTVPNEVKTGALKHSGDYCNDCGTCMLGCCLTGCLIGRNWAATRGEECTICYCCPLGIGEVWVRTNIRYLRGMEEDLCWDGCKAAYCTRCMACADAYELKDILEDVERYRHGGMPEPAPGPIVILS